MQSGGIIYTLGAERDAAERARLTALEEEDENNEEHRDNRLKRQSCRLRGAPDAFKLLLKALAYQAMR